MSSIVTLNDIAKKAEVSTCTVSRYLNANFKFKKEIEQKIEDAIEELGENCAEVILKQINRQEVHYPIMIDPFLVRRESN